MRIIQCQAAKREIKSPVLKLMEQRGLQSQAFRFTVEICSKKF